MRFIEHSLESYHIESMMLAKMVDATGYKPDCIAYLARGSWQIGQACSEYFGVPLVELSAHRSGDSAKEQTHSLLAELPRPIKRYIRQLEITFRLRIADSAGQKKTICITDRFLPPKEPKRILLVDDSADTGASVRLGKGLLHTAYPSAKIKVAVANSFAPAREAGLIDWSLHEDCLTSTPMSKDNRDYERACKAYAEFGHHESGGIV